MLKGLFSRSVDETSTQEGKSSAFMASAANAAAMPLMMVDRDLNITYVNEATKKLVRENLATFRTLVSTIDPDRMLGVCIDVFHKNPSHQRQLLADPITPAAPHRHHGRRSRFALNVSAVFDGPQLYRQCARVGRCHERASTRACSTPCTARRRSSSSRSMGACSTPTEFLRAFGYTIEEIRGSTTACSVTQLPPSPRVSRVLGTLGRGEFAPDKLLTRWQGRARDLDSGERTIPSSTTRAASPSRSSSSRPISPRGDRGQRVSAPR